MAWVTAWLYALDSKLKTTDEQIAEYRKQLEAVTEAYNNGSISVDEYRVQTELLNSKIAEAEARHRTLWWYIEDNFKDTLHSLLYPMDENNLKEGIVVDESHELYNVLNFHDFMIEEGKKSKNGTNKSRQKFKNYEEFTDDMGNDFNEARLTPAGFPVELYFNGEYIGIYTWNINTTSNHTDID